MSRFKAALEFEELDLTPNGILDFFTHETEGYPAAVLRISMGLFAIWKGFGNWINLDRYFTEQGVVPWRHVSGSEHQVFSVLAIAPENRSYVAAVVLVSMLAGLSLTLGLRSRLSALVVFVVSVAVMHRNPFIDNRGDHLFVLIMGLCVLLPLGRVWSVDGLIRRLRGRNAPLATMWSQRLMALQVSYIYLYAFGVKFRSSGWHDGSALYHTYASPGLVEWPVELTSTPLLLVLAWSTIAFEMLFPILVWNRAVRPICIVAGIVFHMSIEITMRIPVFSTLMIITYASYLTDDEVKDFVTRFHLQKLLPVGAHTVRPRAYGQTEAPRGREPG